MSLLRIDRSSLRLAPTDAVLRCAIRLSATLCVQQLIRAASVRPEDVVSSRRAGGKVMRPSGNLMSSVAVVIVTEPIKLPLWQHYAFQSERLYICHMCWESINLPEGAGEIWSGCILRAFSASSARGAEARPASASLRHPQCQAAPVEGDSAAWIRSATSSGGRDIYFAASESASSGLAVAARWRFDR
jgi:hypothetical protein